MGTIVLGGSSGRRAAKELILDVNAIIRGLNTDALAGLTFSELPARLSPVTSAALFRLSGISPVAGGVGLANESALELASGGVGLVNESVFELASEVEKFGSF